MSNSSSALSSSSTFPLWNSFFGQVLFDIFFLSLFSCFQDSFSSFPGFFFDIFFSVGCLSKFWLCLAFSFHRIFTFPCLGIVPHMLFSKDFIWRFCCWCLTQSVSNINKSTCFHRITVWWNCRASSCIVQADGAQFALQETGTVFLASISIYNKLLLMLLL